MDYNLIYGENVDAKKIKNRIENLKCYFKSLENQEPAYIFSSPGRAEILGNHTDHNHGLVMVASISKDILAAVKKSDDNLVKIYSKDYPPIVVDLDELEVNEEEYGTSNALVRGVAKALKDKAFKLGGFTATTESNIYKGAGISSSAAFEVLIVEIFNKLYLNGVISKIERAKISQFAENVYFNKPCGLLDQSGISIGSLVKLDFNQPEQPQINELTMPKGYSIVITNTGGDHAKLTSYYASIRKDMKEIASYFGKEYLRDIPHADFLSQIHMLKKHFSSLAILRAMHFYNENERVLRAEHALLDGNAKEFLSLVNQSGISSQTLLQNCFVPGDANQPIMLAIEFSRSIIKDGAVKVHGGGFAGTIIAIINQKETQNYIKKMSSVFGKDNVFEAKVRALGTTVIE